MPLRVMFVTGTLAHGGAERQSITLMNRLAERGHECHLVHVKRAGTDQVDRIRLRGEGSLHCLGAERYLERRAVADFASHVARTRPAVIVAVNEYALLHASLALRLSGWPAFLVVTFHSMRLLETRQRLQMLAYRPFFWLADCAVFVCENQRHYWSRRAVLARRNAVIHNGVDTEEFRNRPDSAERQVARARLGLRGTDYVIGLSARLGPEKNPLQLVDAMAMLRARNVTARVLMIGDGPLRTAVEARARCLGLDGEVFITGFQQDVRPWIAACDAMVLCSHSEALSLAAIEAMAMGKPFVHSEVGGAAELIRSGDDGFLFPVGDTDALADCLARLADPATRERMGRNARARVESRFSERVMVDRYEQLMREVAYLRSVAGGREDAERIMRAR